jgi:hypothetical protein
MTEAALRLIEEQGQSHVSVMAREVVAAIAPRRGDLFVDATAGAGGHSEALLEAASETRVTAVSGSRASGLAPRSFTSSSPRSSTGCASAASPLPQGSSPISGSLRLS